MDISKITKEIGKVAQVAAKSVANSSAAKGKAGEVEAQQKKIKGVLDGLAKQKDAVKLKAEAEKLVGEMKKLQDMQVKLNQQMQQVEQMTKMLQKQHEVAIKAIHSIR